ncbi:MAG: DEAD/DEAH box helicase family protein [Planctomycetaceae bacterium]
MPARLDQRLVLNEWMFAQLGYRDTQTGMRELAKILRDEPVGWDEQNVFHFRRRLELSLPANRAIDDDLLREYDRNIFEHWREITRKRAVKEHRDIFPLYFQYLALLFTEHFLNRWSRDRQRQETRLLDEINDFRGRFNQRFAGRSAANDRVEKYVEQDLTKLAYWIATGGGKTLIMHCNIRQLDHYLRRRNLLKHFNKYILITPNEGLTEQHLEEFALSDIAAQRYEKDNPGLFDKALVEVIEITKLEEKSGVTTVAVSEFGRRNVVMVDEGHRGVGGTSWFPKRQALCQDGFSLEYSATFGQTVNSLSSTKQKEIGQLYAKGVLFDYSYKFFYGDGYGKDFHILNHGEDGVAGAETRKLYLTACLLRFYQQCRLYEDRHGSYASYLIDDPLMVFVGGSVTGLRQSQHDTDVVAAVKFFAEFIADAPQSIKRLDLLLRQRDELTDGEELVFRNAFDYVREVYPASDRGAAKKLFADVLRLVFNSDGRGVLHAVHLKGSGSEIGLRIGEAGEYFGVINVGESKKLWDLLDENEDDEIICSEQQFSVSLFDRIKEPESPIRLLIGAKKFIEGWSCWRVSCMGLVNIGRKEGSQIIQLFGRGVRLKGLDFRLKRSRELTGREHPQHIGELETLNVFGVRADYMRVFREYIDEEDVASAKKLEIIHLPTIENLARTDLKVILPKREMPEFSKEQKPEFGRYDKMRTKVSSDWYGRLDSKASAGRGNGNGGSQLNCTTLQPINRAFLDYDQLYLDLLHFKKQNAMHNLQINRESVRVLLGEIDWYDLFIPEHMLEFAGFDRVKIWQEIAADLLKKYCLKLYRFKKDEFEGPYQEYRTIQDVLDDPEERYNKQFLQNIRVEYEAAIEKSREQLIKDLRRIKKKIEDGDLQEYALPGGLDIICFDRHLYEPLLHVRKGSVGLTVKPVSLNTHEKQFVDDLKKWCERERDGFLDGRELYVLRNQSRGKGISFFDEGNFYPDFILWLLDGTRQFIAFADPHGLQHARGFSDSKVLFSKRIKEIEKDRLADDDVTLDAFILSPTSFNTIKHWDERADKARFDEHHILFMYDDAESYVGRMFESMLAAVAAT